MSRQRRTFSTSDFEDDYSMDEANSSRLGLRTPRTPRTPSLRRQVLMREQERQDSLRPPSQSRRSVPASGRRVSYGEAVVVDDSPPSPYASPQSAAVAPGYFAYDGVKFVESPSPYRRQGPYQDTERGRVYRKSPYPQRVREGETPPYQVTRSNRKVYRTSPHPARRSQPELVFEDSSPSSGRHRSRSRSRSRSRQAPMEELAPQILDFAAAEEEVFLESRRPEPLPSFSSDDENALAEILPSRRRVAPRRRVLTQDENAFARPRFDGYEPECRHLREGLFVRHPERRLDLQAPPPNDPAQSMRILCKCCNGEIH